MNQTQSLQTIGFGALAGATTMLLCLGLSSGTLLAGLLFYIAPVPLMVAGLGFGLKAALTGAAVAIAGTLAFAGGLTAALVAFFIAVPACVSSHWLNLARPADEIGGPKGQLAWYPLANVLFANALIAALAVVILGVLIRFGPEMVAETADNFFAQIRMADPQIVITPEGEARFRTILENVVPATLPFAWTMALTLSLYIATAISRRSGLLKRPRENWSLALRLPRAASFLLMAAIVVEMVSTGGISHIAATVTGGLGAGFTIAGLAMLHVRTRGMPGRIVLLLVVYMSAAFFGIPVLALIIAGMFGAGRHVPLSPAPSSNPIQAQND